MFGMAFFVFFVGTMTAAFAAVRLSDAVEWPLFALGFACAILGTVGMRVVRRRDAARETRTDAEVETLLGEMGMLRRGLATLVSNLRDADVYEVHRRIDAELLSPLEAFAEARESIRDHFGVDAFAQVMDPFAVGERALNRAWSASADGYIDEVRTAMGRAERSFERAEQTLKGYATSARSADGEIVARSSSGAALEGGA